MARLTSLLLASAAGIALAFVLVRLDHSWSVEGVRRFFPGGPDAG